LELRASVKRFVSLQFHDHFTDGRIPWTSDQLFATLAIVCRKKTGKRQLSTPKWNKNWLLKRNFLSHTNVIRKRTELLSMHEAIQVELLQKIISRIEKSDTIMRKQIAPHERLCITLRFLATGRNCEVVKLSTATSPQALGVIISETCSAIYEELKVMYENLINNKLSSKI
jgi:hypothetical protein